MKTDLEIADMASVYVGNHVETDPTVNMSNPDNRDRRKVVALESIALELNLIRRALVQRGLDDDSR